MQLSLRWTADQVGVRITPYGAKLRYKLMVDLKLRYVWADTDRHGNVRHYFARRGFPKIRIHETPGTPQFSSRYHALIEQSQGDQFAPAPKTPAVTPATLRWLCTQYFGATDFRTLDPTTQRVRRRVLEAMCIEPVFPGAAEVFGDFPLSRLTTKSLRVLRDRKAELPAAANYRVKCLRQLFKWGLEQEHLEANPARDLIRVAHATGGIHSWTPEEIEQFKERHPLKTKAHLALHLMLWTGARRSDVVLLGRQHVRDGWLKFTQQKNRNRRPVVIEIPMLAELQRIIDTSPVGDMTFLMTEYGRPFSVAGFGGWFRERCNEAGLPQCSAHGLRKAGAATAAENGASTQELMSIFGWLTLAEAERYTRAAGKKQLAKGAMHKLIRQDK